MQKARDAIDRGPQQPRGITDPIDEREAAIDEFAGNGGGRLFQGEIHDGKDTRCQDGAEIVDIADMSQPE
jgi:hypothetical protein